MGKVLKTDCDVDTSNTHNLELTAPSSGSIVSVLPNQLHTANNAELLHCGHQMTLLTGFY